MRLQLFSAASRQPIVYISYVMVHMRAALSTKQIFFTAGMLMLS